MSKLKLFKKEGSTQGQRCHETVIEELSLRCNRLTFMPALLIIGLMSNGLTAAETATKTTLPAPKAEIAAAKTKVKKGKTPREAAPSQKGQTANPSQNQKGATSGAPVPMPAPQPVMTQNPATTPPVTPVPAVAPVAPGSPLDRAAQLIDRGLSSDAEHILLSVLAKEPANPVANALMGRIYYRQGNYRIASEFFEKSKVRSLDPISAFEYGVTMYSIKRCDKALKAFVYVPKNHYLRDYARLFGGFCYIQRGEDQKALLVLNNARNLPPSYASMRYNLIELARANIESKAKGGAPAGGAEGAALQPPTQIAAADGKGGAEAPKAEPPKSGLKFSFGATPSYDQKFSKNLQEYHATKRDDYSAGESTLNLNINTKFESYSPSYPYLSLYANGKIYEKNANKAEETWTVNDDDSRYWKVDRYGNKNEVRDEEVSAGPNLGIPLGEKADIWAKYDFWQKTPKDKKNGRWTTHTGELGFHANVAEVDFKISGNYQEGINAAGEPAEYKEGGDLSLSKTVEKIVSSVYVKGFTKEPAKDKTLSGLKDEIDFGVNFTVPFEKFSAYVAVDQRSINSAPGKAYIPWDKLDATRVSLNLERGFDAGFYTKLMTYYEDYQNYAAEGVVIGDYYATKEANGTRDALVNGGTASVAGSLSFPITDFLSISGYVEYAAFQYEILDKELEVGFLKTNPSSKVYMDATLSLKKSF